MEEAPSLPPAVSRTLDQLELNGRKVRVEAHAVLPGEARWLPSCLFGFLPF
jgi:hypothetical protein